MADTDPSHKEAAGAGGSKPDTGAAYRVLARKYRPQTFGDLIGQDAVVRTLTNAFETGRIAQAYMLTGVRGVGKTTTARLVARALNYSLPDGPDRPTTAMDAIGEHCEAIMESRHVDVIEMDAASHTGIDDIREIIESVRYRPVSARYKVYIVDEVHMLSKHAFNGLLKTLEEPPPHVKFIFATTEIRKVPVTVLSRCQRFDLRRVDAGQLVGHFTAIAKQEGADIEPEALMLIARASEGSVRDGLSLLDQAIAQGSGAAGTIGADQVRSMLGLVDRARTIDLFEHIMRGDAAAALGELKEQYDTGADPSVVLADMADLVHWITRLKLVEDAANDATMSETERTKGAELAGRLNMRILARAWQMLLKGVAEAQSAANALAAADMVLVRMAHAADLPTPDELIRSVQAGDLPASRPPSSATAGPQSRSSQPAPQAQPPVSEPVAQSITTESVRPSVSDGPPDATAELDVPQHFERFEDVVALVSAKRDIRLKRALEHDVRLVSFRHGQIDLQFGPDAPKGLANDLGRKLTQWTGERWIVAVSREDGQKTIAERNREERQTRIEEASRDPLVQAVLKKFPDAKVSAVTDMKDLIAGDPDANISVPDDDAAVDPYDEDVDF